MSKADTNPAWINTSVLVGAGLLYMCCRHSSIFAVIVLTRKTSACGFGEGCVIALFGITSTLFVTTFFRAGLQQLSICFRQVQLHRPDLLIAVPFPSTTLSTLSYE